MGEIDEIAENDEGDDAIEVPELVGFAMKKRPESQVWRTISASLLRQNSDFTRLLYLEPRHWSDECIN